MKTEIKDNSIIKSLDWVTKCYCFPFGIVLPTGWFGRPFDNHHVLNSVEVNDKYIKLVFDDVNSITIYEPKSYEIIKEVRTTSLFFDYYEKIEFATVPYGEERTTPLSIKSFRAGALRLVGYFSL